MIQFTLHSKKVKIIGEMIKSVYRYQFVLIVEEGKISVWTENFEASAMGIHIPLSQIDDKDTSFRLFFNSDNRTFFDYIEKRVKDEHIIFTIESDSVIIEYGSKKVVFESIDPPSNTQEWNVKKFHSGKVVSNLVRNSNKIRLSVDNKDSRFVFRGIFIDSENMIGTNGRQLSIIKHESEIPFSSKIIPLLAFDWLKKFCKEDMVNLSISEEYDSSSGLIKITPIEKSIFDPGISYELYITPIDGIYPDVKQVFPKTNTEISFNRGQFISALKDVAFLKKDKNIAPVRITVNGRNLTLSTGKFIESFNLIEGEANHKVHFNVYMLLSILNDMWDESDIVTMKFDSDRIGAPYIFQTNVEGWFHVCMPMRD